MSGTEMQRAKESAAEIMRQKQAAGTFPSFPPFPWMHKGDPTRLTQIFAATAEAKKAAEGAKK